MIFDVTKRAAGAAGISIDTSVDYLSGVEWFRGNMSATNGRFTPDDSSPYYTTDFINVSGLKGFAIITTYSGAALVGYSASFYNENKAFIQRSVSACCNPTVNGGIIPVIPVPPGATYYRMAMYYNVVEGGVISVYAANGRVTMPVGARMASNLSALNTLNKGAKSISPVVPVGEEEADIPLFVFDEEETQK